MLTISKLYNSHGDLLNINDTLNGIPFFRKEFYQDSNNEREIVRIIKKNTFKNVVNIYTVDHKYYDAELLNTSITLTDEVVNKIISDMEDAKTELQNKGIIYIDWKPDNLGFSVNDNVYKIFDFDSSGIISKQCQEWIRPPPHRWLYKKAIEKGLYSPFEIDNECFNIFCKELKELVEKNSIK
jgi:serine/threonine protein kinase